VREEKGIREEKLGIREWIEDDDNKMGNLNNSYYKL